MFPRFLFLMGAPRSGTTILHHILNVHPQVHLSNEWSIPELISHFNHWMHIRPWIDKMFIHQFLWSLFRHHSPHKVNATWFGDKCPGLFGYYDVLKLHFPRMILLETLRNPYAITASGLNRTDKGWTLKFQQHIENIADTWDMHRRADKEGIHVITVRLEDLIDNTENVIKDICFQLDIPCSQYYIDEIKYLISVPKSKVNQLSDNQRLLVDELLGERIKEMGY